MNLKETLKKLNETFPDFDIDTLLKILDCYVESPTTLPNTTLGMNFQELPRTSPKPWEDTTYYQGEINTRY